MDKNIKTLKPFFIIDNEDNKYIEIGVDEAGRGPMFGRVYSAAVILPKDDTFNHSLMKDSKKFNSVKKIREAAEYIKQNAISWHVSYACEKTIDQINIRNATHKAMHEAINEVITKTINNNIYYSGDKQNYHLLVDGCDFTPFISKNIKDDNINISHTCIEGGDNLYSAIAAASILAKVERDKYIEEMCIEEPVLITKYDLLNNKGYGTKKHMEGIQKYGISLFHRRSFGICKMFT